jgi:Zn-finger nucleic acid-binding protein
MKCPVDDETLVMTDRNGVEIDYCPKCRGVWLDRGELDKIIERAVPDATKDSVRHFPQDRQDIGDRRQQTRHKKRESFLSELFDF